MEIFGVRMAGDAGKQRKKNRGKFLRTFFDKA
jgi:hypothetical protein